MRDVGTTALRRDLVRVSSVTSPEAAPACGEQRYRARARNEVSVSFNRRRSRCERAGGDYGTLRTDYSARTFRRGRPHPRDLGALSGPPARIYFRSRRRRARRRARRRRLRHVADRLLSADVREGSPAPPGLDASTSARGHFCFRSGRRRSRRPPRGVENSYLLSAWLLARRRRGARATWCSRPSTPSPCRSTAWPVFVDTVARRVENSYSF